MLNWTGTGGRGGGWGPLKFSCIRRLGSFWGFKVLNFNIFGGFQNNWYFFGYEDFVDIFWGHHKIWLYILVISLHFRVFSWGQGKESGVFFVLPKFQIFFWGAWNSWCFWGWTVDAGPELTYEENKEEYPPPCLGIGIGERYGEEFLELWVYYPSNGRFLGW